AYIDGKWVDADSKATFNVTNPANGDIIADVPDMGAGETHRAIAAAKAALPVWGAWSPMDKSKALKHWHSKVIEHADHLAQIISREQGKPLAEAKGEVLYSAGYIEWYAEETKRIYGDILPHNTNGRRLLVYKQPVGVCGLITPWNFPVAMAARKIAPALAAGCTVVLKPAEDTPLSAIALMKLVEMSDLPPGVVNLVTCQKSSSPAVGGALTSSPDVAKISFTGSTGVGKLLMKQSSDTVKRMSMELGGNASFIVFDDADLDAAVAGAIASKFRNSGQTCVCTNRFLVQDGVYEAFTKKLTAAVNELVVGNGLDAGTTQGPLINKAAVEKVEKHMADALAKGAKVVTGGKNSAVGELFYEPTVLTGVTTDMLVSSDETFGPLAPLIRFTTEEEAIALANDTLAGLANYFYTKDNARIWRVSEALNSGMVGVNEGIISTELAPFGGVKQSGFGREGSKYGINDYLDTKYVCVGQIE
ncbi:succinate-semialdehyde dehydrogenase [NADP+], partial [Sphaeroforma arctica JP610]